MPRTVAELVADLHALGVEEGDVLLVHTSFRAVRPVERGPEGLVEALARAVGEEGTVVMPSWPDDARIPFQPATARADAELGVVADTFWRHPDVRRSSHVQAFAAWGRDAEVILRDPLPLPPHRHESPVGRVFDLEGKVLLLGVDHDANTTIHLGEVLADVPYGLPKRCWSEEAGQIVEYWENDHCCQRFRMVGDWLRERGAERLGRVGSAQARLIPSSAVVEVVVEKLGQEPLLFLHAPEAGCRECDEARASVDASR